MLSRVLGRLGKETTGSVAPTVALSLIGLIAAGGLAFDYARMAAMDTELQNAADQAALAAASQLDQKAGACSRAALAASAMVRNDTLFANDGSAITISVANEGTCDATGSIRFYQDKAKTTAADADSNANFVQVQVATRRANYAFTAIISAMFQDLTAYAYAGLDSAVCKVPPLMMCNPTPGVNFDPDDYRGAGLKLVLGGNNAWAPGAFGYLDVGQANNGTPDQRAAMAYNNPALSCASVSQGDVDTGLSSTVFDAVNVRFDMFQNGWANNTCANSATCSPARNTTKDVVQAESGASSCGYTNNTTGWHLPADADQYVASNADGDDSTVVHMGYPMDICHYPLGGGGCTRLGNGNWRPDIYFKTNHEGLSLSDGSNWQTVTGLTADASRYDFYQWELTSSNLPDVTRGSKRQRGAPVCNTTTPSGSTLDRRVVVVAVADNCSELSGGSTGVNIGAWAEVFLTMPAGIARTAAGITSSELYVEIIKEAEPSGNGSTTAQLIRRDVPYLIE